MCVDLDLLRHDCQKSDMSRCKSVLLQRQDKDS